MASRIERETALLQPTRRRVHDMVASQPGCRMGTVARTLDVDFKTIEWHVRALARAGLVERAGDGRLYLRHASLGNREKAAFAAASSPVARRILAHLREKGTTDLETLCGELGLPKSSASGALLRLRRAGVVQGRRALRRLIVELPPPAAPATGFPMPG